MSRKPSALGIGLFILGAVGVLLAALFMFGIRKSFEKKHRLVTYIPGDVEGLSVGSPVKLKGVSVGEVTGLYFAWNRYPGTKTPCVIVEFDIREDVSPVPIHSDGDFEPAVKQAVAWGLRAIVKSQGVTGTSFVELELLNPERNPAFVYDWPQPRFPLVPSAPSQIGKLLDSARQTFARLEKVDTEKIGLQVEKTLAAAEAALRRIGEFDAKGVSAGATRTLESANAAVLEVQGLARAAKGKVDEVPAGAVGEDVRRLLAGLDETNRKIQAAVDRLSAVDVGELNDALGELRIAARGLAETVSTVRKQPSQLILGDAPPPASSLQKEEKK